MHKDIVSISFNWQIYSGMDESIVFNTEAEAIEVFQKMARNLNRPEDGFDSLYEVANIIWSPETLNLTKKPVLIMSPLSMVKHNNVLRRIMLYTRPSTMENRFKWWRNLSPEMETWEKDRYLLGMSDKETYKIRHDHVTTLKEFLDKRWPN